MDILIGILEQGLIYSILALGVYITYEVLKFPDLTVDGSFPLGAAVSVRLISLGYKPLISLLVAFLAGLLAGFVTGLLHVRFKIKDLLAGVIVMTALFSINLAIAGQANLPIFNRPTIFNGKLVEILPGPFKDFGTIFLGLIMVALVKVSLDFYFKTKSGLVLRAVGENPNLLSSLAVNPNAIKLWGLSLANGIVALAGGLVSQEQRFFEVSMGTGAMVMGLASVIIGLKIFGPIRGLKDTGKVVLGSIIYKGVTSFAIGLGLPAIYMKLLTAIILFVILILGKKEGQADVRTQAN